jgi:hypothetical protein
VKLFGRQASLQVDGKLYQGLDLDFDVDRHDGSDPNKATIKVANLSATERAYVQAKGKRATLSAGYGNPGIIFNGGITRAFHERQGGDVVTTLECTDGGQALQLASVDIALEAGATDAQVLERCLQVLAAQGIGRGFIAEFKPKAYTQAFCYSGPVKRLLDNLCKRQQLAWGIEGGLVEVVKPGPIRKEITNIGVSGMVDEIHSIRGVLLSPETGLIGFPSQKGNLVLAKSLLNPSLAPRRALKLQSSQTLLNGVYMIQKAKFLGNTRSGDFTVDIEAARDITLREP